MGVLITLQCVPSEMSSQDVVQWDGICSINRKLFITKGLALYILSVSYAQLYFIGLIKAMLDMADPLLKVELPTGL